MPSHYRSGREWQREDHVFFSYSVRVLEVFFFFNNACVMRRRYLYDLILIRNEASITGFRFRLIRGFK